MSLRAVGRAGDREVFLRGDLAVAVLVELIGAPQLHVDELVDRDQAFALLRLLLAALLFTRLLIAKQSRLHDATDLRLADFVVAIRVVVVELGVDDRLGLGSLDEAVAIGVEVLELSARAGAALFQRRHAGTVCREGCLSDLHEFVE